MRSTKWCSVNGVECSIADGKEGFKAFGDWDLVREAFNLVIRGVHIRGGFDPYPV